MYLTECKVQFRQFLQVWDTTESSRILYSAIIKCQGLQFWVEGHNLSYDVGGILTKVAKLENQFPDTNTAVK
jgi:hypothetical protein